MFFPLWLVYLHMLHFDSHMTQFACDSFVHLTLYIFPPTWFISCDASHTIHSDSISHVTFFSHDSLVFTRCLICFCAYDSFRMWFSHLSRWFQVVFFLPCDSFTVVFACHLCFFTWRISYDSLIRLLFTCMCTLSSPGHDMVNSWISSDRIVWRSHVEWMRLFHMENLKTYLGSDIL